MGASGETSILFYSRVLCGSVCILPLSNKSFYSIIIVYCNIYSNISCIFWNSFFLQNLLLIIIIPPLKRRKVYSVLPLCVRRSVCPPVCLTVYLGGFFCTNLTSTSCYMTTLFILNVNFLSNFHKKNFSASINCKFLDFNIL